MISKTKHGVKPEVDQLKYFQTTALTLLKEMNTKLSNRSKMTDRENEEEIRRIDNAIFENDANIRKVTDLLARAEWKLSSNADTMKSKVMGANYEMVSWIMEGYACHAKSVADNPMSNEPAQKLSELGNCLVTLMSQPCPCKISVDLQKVISKIRRKLADDVLSALFRCGQDDQYGFSEKVEYLAVYFIYAATFTNFTGTCEALIYARYDALMTLGQEFVKGSRNIYDGQARSTRSCAAKVDIKTTGAAGTSANIRVLPANSRVFSPPPTPKLDTFCPYRVQSHRPDFQLGMEHQFPCFLMEGKACNFLESAKMDLEHKLEFLNERTFSGLPFYISAAITPVEAQFMLSEHGSQHPTELGEVYNIGDVNGAAKFLLAFLNLLPIFEEFKNILRTRQPDWNENITSASRSSVFKAVAEKKFADEQHQSYVHHIYFQKSIDSSKCVSSYEELRNTYAKLVPENQPDSLPTLLGNQTLKKIFTVNAKTFTIRLHPVAFPGRAETFLTSYRLVAQCFYDVLSALVWLHECGIVHRDVVGRNILKKICKKGFILTDFESTTAAPDPDLVGESNTKKWFPRDDIAQLSTFLRASSQNSFLSSDKFLFFQELVSVDGKKSAIRNLEVIKDTNSLDACREIIKQIKVRFEEYISPFQKD